MKKILILSLLFVLSVSFTFSKTVAGRHQIELDDPVGDVQENDGKPGKDVTHVGIVSDGENLHVTVELAKNVSYYLNDQLAGPVIEMHFNTDNNDKTGGIPFWGTEKKGFEYEVDVVACIQYENGGLACLGALGDKIKGFASSYKVSQYEQDQKSPKSVSSALEHVQNEITGKTVEVTIPYSEIGIKSGNRIRILIRESDSTFNDASYFPDVFFIVK